MSMRFANVIPLFMGITKLIRVTTTFETKQHPPLPPPPPPRKKKRERNVKNRTPKSCIITDSHFALLDHKPNWSLWVKHIYRNTNGAATLEVNTTFP